MRNQRAIDVLVLSGGRARRLEEYRKIINKEHYPMLAKYAGEEGPKGLTLLNIKDDKIPLLDLHLEQYWRNPSIKEITLGLGFASQMIMDYYQGQEHTPCFVVEERPAGTIAPLLKLYQNGKLSDRPLLLANGDNLLELDLTEIWQKAEEILNNFSKEQQAEIAINILTLVPWEQSDAYGVVDFDAKTQLIHHFFEKQSVEQNPYIIIKDRRYSYINSGFSLILNPKTLIETYVDPTIFSLVEDLEQGKKAYALHETQVKYETLYSTLAPKKRLIGIHHHGFWADSGSETQILAIEAHYAKIE
ncbi:sugar phosphate nucleotidyltransferase [Entomospira culicis]|uniref:NDP-sugar synthase n=1 Tax=Entomospira culicis TaxID=2719989 RepID=A0A968KVH2_9SPIO|nr:NDP-sugar synthase [Entomospira culicis]NIZ18898.1 NDP-sugar synthase [Entomospira culicis]NIZ69113.1 NDP-sugar synthase [Entomospira culicis]WDI37699.1 NDP-sugar synthase [Entomospira culicis]WDI39327.1 NDP-sugar synthase [Entomospira culicis]